MVATAASGRKRTFGLAGNACLERYDGFPVPISVITGEPIYTRAYTPPSFALALGQGDAGFARTLADECRDIERQIGGRDADQIVSTVVLEQGDALTALAICRDALAKPIDPQNTEGLLETVACAEAALGKFPQAAIIWGHAERLRQGGGMPFMGRMLRLRHERGVALARAGLGDSAKFDAAWRRGTAMSTDQVIELVLSASEM